MKSSSPYTTWEDQQMDKFELDSFAHNRKNILDAPIDKLIDDLKKEIEKAFEDHNYWVNLEENNPAKFRELEDQANLSDHTLYSQMAGYITDAMYMEEELFALFEMKIIYAFKHLEINIKQLLFQVYQDEYINRQFKWDSIVQFLHSKNIAARDLLDYDNVNQLRNLNNSLKHADKVIDQSVKNIPELAGKETMEYKDLELFYQRVKQSPTNFLTSLVSAVFKDMYSFPYERVVELAKSYALRMEKKDADIFKEELLKLYKQ